MEISIKGTLLFLIYYALKYNEFLNHSLFFI